LLVHLINDVLWRSFVSVLLLCGGVTYSRDTLHSRKEYGVLSVLDAPMDLVRVARPGIVVVIIFRVDVPLILASLAALRLQRAAPTSVYCY